MVVCVFNCTTVALKAQYKGTNTTHLEKLKKIRTSVFLNCCVLSPRGHCTIFMTYLKTHLPTVYCVVSYLTCTVTYHFSVLGFFISMRYNLSDFAFCEQKCNLKNTLQKL